MKKNSLIKIIIFLFIAFVIMTWMIPVGSFDNNMFSLGVRKPIGLTDMFKVPLISLASLFSSSILILVIGLFYGVLNKTGAYQILISKIVNKFKNKENLFIILVIILLSILTSIIGISALFLIIMPLLVAIIMKLGFNRKTALAIAIGPGLIGSVASLFGSEVVFYNKANFYLNITENLFTKIILLIMLIILYSYYVTAKAKRENISDIPLYEESFKKRSTIPLIILLLLMFIVIGLGTINLAGLFGNNSLSNIYNHIMNYKINDYKVISNILGNVSVFGKWNNYDICVCIIIISLIMGWVYSIKFDLLIDSFKKGIKSVLKPAFYVAFASILYIGLYYIQGSSNIYLTISHFLLTLFKGAKIVMLPLVSLIGGFFHFDYASLNNTLTPVIETLVTDTTKYSLITFMMQTIYYMAMFILPTSVLLVTLLSYLNVSYKEWLKYIIKFILMLIVILPLFYLIINHFI